MVGGGWLRHQATCNWQQEKSNCDQEYIMRSFHGGGVRLTEICTRKNIMVTMIFLMVPSAGLPGEISWSPREFQVVHQEISHGHQEVSCRQIVAAGSMSNKPHCEAQSSNIGFSNLIAMKS